MVRLRVMTCPAPLSPLRFTEDDLTGPEIGDLLRLHLAEMHRWSPPESVHAMPVATPTWRESTTVTGTDASRAASSADSGAFDKGIGGAIASLLGFDRAAVRNGFVLFNPLLVCLTLGLMHRAYQFPAPLFAALPNDHVALAVPLVNALRRIGLHDSDFAQATCGTIRLKLLKIGALVRISVRRIKIAMASACPSADDWGRAARRLADGQYHGAARAWWL